LEGAIDETAGNPDPCALRNRAFIAEAISRVKSWIAPLNIAGKRTPMFFVFPISLDGACYVRLSEALGDDQPFYAFQIPSKERKPETATSISDIAGRLVAEFENIYRQGDFILGGWSAGAILALEMAQQLTQKGRSPALLAAIDHAPFNTGAGINPSYPSLLNDAIRLRVLWKKSRDEKWKAFIPSPSLTIAKKISSRIAKLSSHAQRNLRAGNAPIGLHPIQKAIDDAKTPESRELLKKLYKLLIEYKPSRYDGPVLLFLSAEHAEYEYDRKWSAFARHVKTCHFLGTSEDPTLHESFIRGAQLDYFARILKEEVDLFFLKLGNGQRTWLCDKSRKLF
jgi:thioesterase domain-containing protein